ncbi:cellulose synthase operon protein YhjQ [Enterobacterales bacterium BIT-L3]|uniref:Cellulose synthase operon protein YhjQ n=2 Tax=Tenebrionibacter/Tenebrionicola group TaxID=2969848 RepID=A0A8K0XXN7_9ENTR|nr:cellulose synthase operon protein YhjQ [Tenebrionibacter intestinalis]
MMYFNIPFTRPEGWARAMHDGQAWQHAAWRYTSRLDVLPFGQFTQAQSVEFFARAENVERFIGMLTALKSSGRYRWILLDIPAGFSACVLRTFEIVDHVITVARPDTNCHVRLHQQPMALGSYLLVNGFQVSSRLQDDIWQMWLQSHKNLTPLVIHQDEAMAECAAAKQPLGEYQPQSLAAEEVMTLANWCLLNFAGDAT